MRTDTLDWSLPGHRRGTLGGMDAAKELTGTYLQCVPRWWTGKGPATKARSAALHQTHPHRSITSSGQPVA
ncbi:hypothetical protein G8D12_10585 [Xanthomonas vesicatoria]|nr:hypothetical protein [Xanthomonas vesicatoria]